MDLNFHPDIWGEVEFLEPPMPWKIFTQPQHCNIRWYLSPWRSRPPLKFAFLDIEKACVIQCSYSAAPLFSSCGFCMLQHSKILFSASRSTLFDYVENLALLGAPFLRFRAFCVFYKKKHILFSKKIMDWGWPFTDMSVKSSFFFEEVEFAEYVKKIIWILHYLMQHTAVKEKDIFLVLLNYFQGLEYFANIFAHSNWQCQGFS